MGEATADYLINQTIFSQGEDADFVFFIQEGSVKLTATNHHGHEVLIGIAKEGQFFGEACLLDAAVRVATAKALSNCRITSVTKAAILSTIRERPKFAKLFFNYLSDHNSWVQEYMSNHVPKSAERA